MNAKPSEGPSILLMVSTGARVGAATIVSGLARGLHDRGFRVSVLCCMKEEALAGELASHDIPTGLHAVRWPFDPVAIERLRVRLIREEIDVVHTHGQRAMMAGNLAARLAGTPVVVTSFHEHAWVKSTIRPGVYRLSYMVEGWLARHWTDACVATCQSVLEDAVRVRRVPRERLSLIYNAADSGRYHASQEAAERERLRRRFGLGPQDFVIGTLASLMPVKAHEDLISALPHIRRRVPNARLLIGGIGPRRAALERHAAGLGVTADVIFAGDVPDPERVYAVLDVFGSCSLSEVCPLVVLEAFACRVPVVATAVGGVPELIRTERDGLLVPVRDPAALAAAILRLACDPSLRGRLVDSAEARGRRVFSERHFVDGHVELYQRLLARPRPRAAGRTGPAG